MSDTDPDSNWNVPDGGGRIEVAETTSNRRRGSSHSFTDPELQRIGDTSLVPHPTAETTGIVSSPSFRTDPNGTSIRSRAGR
ncbi:hypothetical protein [Halalkalicoccus ordinarius]|uniref:hypothetical protein n=1 Tax=Halalkalicoccus ordinarius TaxID=3116651 RepID=UPI00300E96A0